MAGGRAGEAAEQSVKNSRAVRAGCRRRAGLTSGGGGPTDPRRSPGWRMARAQRVLQLARTAALASSARLRAEEGKKRAI
jgi:hypothetical protein